jgi:medium-chain acyl-[acyl-carrier-protein] hydrolase
VFNISNGQAVKLRRWRTEQKALLRLICFSYAGGNTSMFKSWTESLPGNVEVCAVELPGRDSLFNEPPFVRLPPLIQIIADSIDQSLELPYMLFGHSMGALLAFELARELRQRGAPAPATLFVSAHRAPHLPDPRPAVAELPDTKFIDELQRLQGTPPEALGNRELMVLLLPLLRADFALCENYEYKQDIPLECTIVAFGGLNDAELEYQEVLAWREHTSGDFRIFMMPGNHFFIHTAKEPMLEVLTAELTCRQGSQ